jgi:ribonuclease HI
LAAKHLHIACEDLYRIDEVILNKSLLKETFVIFTDAATSSKHSFSVGAFICVSRQHIEKFNEFTDQELYEKLSEQIVYHEYASHKSTWSEIKTAIDALYSIIDKSGVHKKCEIYTDCQSLYDLINERRVKLEKNNFMTSSGKIHTNADLYRELFAISEKFAIQVFKIKGHSPAAHRLTVHEKIFTILDKSCRKKLRCSIGGK